MIMKSFHLIILIIFCLLMISPKNNAAAGSAKVSETPPPLEVHKAFLVFSRERWGCLLGQEIKGDVTALLGSGEAGVRWEEIKNPEDRQDRLELYLYFPAGPVSGLPGYLVLKLGVGSTDPKKPGEVRLKNAALTRGPQGPVFELQGEVQGDLAADLLYAKDFRWHQGLFSCPEASLFEPVELNFLKAYAVKTGLEPIMAGPSAARRINIPLRGFWLDQTRRVAAAAELLDLLDDRFKVAGKFNFLWDKAGISPPTLEAAAAAWDQGKGLKSHIALKLRDRQGTKEIRRTPVPFNPQLRQKIAIQEAPGRIIGGEVWIAIDPAR
jgi:hypothetical protein